jgi:hypothetical protein
MKKFDGGMYFFQFCIWSWGKTAIVKECWVFLGKSESLGAHEPA